MAYRGEDLDLRTPQTWAATPPDLSGSAEPIQNGTRNPYRPAPLLVDDTVLACCNYAYDVAAANRALEVRVEHLLNALTRMDAAVAVLEARGVRVAALRRETATLLASDSFPVSGGGLASPRRSDELADVLKAAAMIAHRRNGAASIDDILQVLVDKRTEFPSSELLLRHWPRTVARDYPEPLPPLTRSAPDQRYGAGGYRYGAEALRVSRGDLAGTPTDVIQNSRIEALEQTVRALSLDFSNERQLLAGLVRDLTRETQAHQDDQGRRQSVLLDRIGTLEQSVLNVNAGGSSSGENLVTKLENIEAALELRLQEMSQSWSVLSTRLQDLELTVREGSGGARGTTLDEIRSAINLKPMSDRLELIEAAVLGGEPRSGGDVSERFDKLETQLAQIFSNSTGGGQLESLPTGVERVGGITDKLNEIQETVGKAISDFSERLAGVERAVTGEIETAAAKHQAYANDLTEVHEALMKINQNQHTLAGSMDQWRTDSATDVANILSSIAGVKSVNELPATTLNALNIHMDTMNRLIIERYYRRNRFWYWLFGTDDWIGASWRSQQAAIEAERQRVRDAAERPAS